MSITTCTNLLAAIVKDDLSGNSFKDEDYRYADHIAEYLLDMALDNVLSSGCQYDSSPRQDQIGLLVGIITNKYEELGLFDRAGELALAYAEKLGRLDDQAPQSRIVTTGMPRLNSCMIKRYWAIYPILEDLYHRAAELFIRADRGDDGYYASSWSLYFYYSRS